MVADLGLDSGQLLASMAGITLMVPVAMWGALTIGWRTRSGSGNTEASEGASRPF